MGRRSEKATFPPTLQTVPPTESDCAEGARSDSSHPLPHYSALIALRPIKLRKSLLQCLGHLQRGLLCKYYSTIKPCNKASIRKWDSQRLRQGGRGGRPRCVAKGTAKKPPAPTTKPLLLPPRPPATQACSVELAAGAQFGPGIRHTVRSLLERGPALDSWHSHGTHLIWRWWWGGWGLQLAW